MPERISANSDTQAGYTDLTHVNEHLRSVCTLRGMMPRTACRRMGMGMRLMRIVYIVMRIVQTVRVGAVNVVMRIVEAVMGIVDALMRIMTW